MKKRKKRLLYNKRIIIHFLFNLNLRQQVKTIIKIDTLTNDVHILQYNTKYNLYSIICRT